MSSPTDSPAETGQPGPDQTLPKAPRPIDPEKLSHLRHDLRTPLNQIIGYSEMLMESAEENGITPVLASHLKAIHTGGGQLIAMINDALAAWKIESGKIDFLGMRRGAHTPLSAIIRDVELCLAEARNGGSAELASDFEKILKAANNLRALFENEDFLGQDGTHGPAENSDLAADDEVDSIAAAPLPVIAGPDIGLASVPTPGARLLAVDDDAMNRDMLVRRLKKLGHSVTEAASGREAVAKLKDGNFDLVLLDIRMPDLNGYETLEIMKGDPRLKHVPVIMLTALDDVESNVQSIEAGAEDYVAKPFNPVILRTRINASLDKKRARDKEQAYLAQLQVERAKSDRLLLNVLPKAIADRLKAGERTIVDSFIDSTVLFADIVGFTRIAARQSPHRTVQLLNEIFSGFDRIAEQLTLEKIKTIGDAYMMVSGVPIIRSDHAEVCAAAAFEMLDAVRHFNRRHQLDWNIRIGMNSGAVVAGIIGTKKFSYDLWGDTVNIASRMESHGQPGQIQVSEATKKLLEGKYDFKPMGVIEIKNSVPMPTYLLIRQGAKPATSPSLPT